MDTELSSCRPSALSKSRVQWFALLGELPETTKLSQKNTPTTDNTKVPKRWRGIGIRIEDDVVVTETGCDVLTDDVPKRADDIEALMKQAS